MKEGNHISDRDVWGKVVEDSLLNKHRILVPPRARGIIKKIAKKSEYTVAESLLTVTVDEKEEEYMTMQIMVYPCSSTGQ